jgi:malonyl-CoA O-methyltransferase
VNRVDKRRVRLAFSRAAPGYDRRDRVQALVRARVLASLPLSSREGSRVLDVGAGTGALLAALPGDGGRVAAVDLAPGMCREVRRRVPRAAVAVADAEALPFADRTFDLVVSTSALQWLPRLDLAAAELARVLSPGGQASIALFGERTLHELRAAWQAAGGGRAAHRFASLSELAAALSAAGLRVERAEEDELLEHHPDARAVLRALKAIGAQGAAPGREGLGGAGVVKELLRRYDGLREARGVPATFHVLHAVARRR